MAHDISMYSNKAEKPNLDIYADLKFKKNNFGLQGLYKTISALSQQTHDVESMLV